MRRVHREHDAPVIEGRKPAPLMPGVVEYPQTCRPRAPVRILRVLSQLQACPPFIVNENNPSRLHHIENGRPGT
jgi:hypothetical protein